MFRQSTKLCLECLESRHTPGGGIWDTGDDVPPPAYEPTKLEIGQLALGGDVMLNPQPLPPGGDVMLNPQPLPPRQISLGDELALNPQPLPPRVVHGPLSDEFISSAQVTSEVPVTVGSPSLQPYVHIPGAPIGEPVYYSEADDLWLPQWHFEVQQDYGMAQALGLFPDGQLDQDYAAFPDRGDTIHVSFGEDRNWAG